VESPGRTGKISVEMRSEGKKTEQASKIEEAEKMIASNNSPVEKRTRLQCVFLINIMELLFCDRKYFLIVTQKMKIKSSYFFHC
jgi:hypothetical protein